MSALRTSSPRIDARCPCCGIRGVLHRPLGHDEPVTHPPSVIRLMRVPLEDRLAGMRRAA